MAPWPLRGQTQHTYTQHAEQLENVLSGHLAGAAII